MCLLGVVILMGVLTGCGGNIPQTLENKETQTESTDDLTVVGFSQLGSESVWRTAHTASIQEALSKQNGYFLIYENARQRQENQMKTIRSYISQRVDYIVFSPVTESGWDTVLQEAKDANIPVIMVDRMADVKDDSLYTTMIGMDAVEEGRKAGEWLEQFLFERTDASDLIHIIEMEGTEGSSAQLGRSEGFHEIANHHDNWRILERPNGEFTTTKGKEMMLSMLQKYQGIDVVVSQNDDMTFGIIEALEEKGISYGEGGDVCIISFDAVHKALEMVSEGKINVDVECNPLQGEYVRNVLEKLKKGEPVEKRYVVKGTVFTKENAVAELGNRKY